MVDLQCVKVELAPGAMGEFYVRLVMAAHGWELPRVAPEDGDEDAWEHWLRLDTGVSGIRVRVGPRNGGDLGWFSLDHVPDLPVLDRQLLAQGLRRLGYHGGRHRICAIVGCKATSTRYTPAVERQAFLAGSLAARLGFVVLTGGLSGVMSSAAAGARHHGGTTLGILPGDSHHEANAHISLVLPSGIGYARNYLTALGCDVMIAVPGGNGTLEEMLFALDFGRVVLSWGGPAPEGAEVIQGQDPVELERRLIRYLAEVHSSHT